MNANRVLFVNGFRAAAIADASVSKFNPVLTALAELPALYHFAIEGHTDDVPVSGGVYRSNWADGVPSEENRKKNRRVVIRVK